MSLPSEAPAGALSVQPPKAPPATPPVPSGLAHDPANGNLQADATATTHKKNKGKKNAATGQPAGATPAAPS